MNGFERLVQGGADPAALLQIGLDTIARHGPDPCTRPQAAAHEAGHWVVGDTLGLGPYRKLRLFKCSGLWEGESLAGDNRDVNLLQEPERYCCHALNTIAGFLGECKLAAVLSSLSAVFVTTLNSINHTTS